MKGLVYIWYVFTVTGVDAAPRVIDSSVIPELPDALEAGAENGSRCWFLAVGDRGDIIWIHMMGEQDTEGSPIYHMGSDFLTYPCVCCYVYARDGHVFDPLHPG